MSYFVEFKGRNSGGESFISMLRVNLSQTDARRAVAYVSLSSKCSGGENGEFKFSFVHTAYKDKQKDYSM